MARPEGPGAAPFRDHLNAVSSLWVGICNGCSGANHVISAGMGVYGCNGRLAGSWSCAKVAWVPGAGGVAMRACHAADNSPWCTKCLARWALLAEASVCCCAGGFVSGAARRCSHSPRWKAARRRRHTSLGKVRVPGGGCRSMRCRRSQRVQARVDSSSVRAAMICPRLECKAALSRPRMNCGGVANVKVLVRMVPRRSMRSRLCSARLMVASFGTVLAVLDGACCCCSAGGAAVFAVWVTSARVELVELVEEVLLSLLLSLLLSWDAVLGLQASPFGSVGGGVVVAVWRCGSAGWWALVVPLAVVVATGWRAAARAAKRSAKKMVEKGFLHCGWGVSRSVTQVVQHPR